MKKNFLKIFIFFMIIFLTPKVFAAETNLTNKIKALTDYTSGTYYGMTPVVVPVPNYYNVNTRYNGTLSQIEFYIDTDDFDWNYNTTYTLTMKMATDDWRNHFMGPQVFRANSDGTIPSSASNMYVSNTFRFVSMKQIKFNFKIPSTMGPYIKVRLYSTNTTNTAFTGVSNWNLSSITIAPTTNPPAPTPVPSTPTPTPQPNNQDIINNNTQNTQDIINNNNQNTTDIIDNNTQNTSDIINNNNSNTEQIVDSINNQNKNCKVNLVDLAHPVVNTQPNNYIVFYQNNELDISSSGGSTGRIVFKINKMQKNTTYKISYGTYNSDTTTSIFRVRVGSSSGTWLTDQLPVENNQEITFNSGDNTEAYLWFYVLQTTPLKVSIYDLAVYNPDYCVDTRQQQTDAINDVNNSINNSNIDSGVGSGFFSDFQDNQHGLTGIITAPLTAIERLTSSTCQPLVLPIPFTNGSVSLPCMTQVYETNIPTIYNIWKVVSFGIIAYFICLDIFHIVKGFKDPESDKVEVLDL